MASAPPMRCDFCGALVPRVRRVALDEGYDRLSRRHAARFACEPCSEKKESERQAGVEDGRPPAERPSGPGT